ncbi:glycosyltransferase family 2 protein [Pirellulaceae bacterium SH467]|jgi:glycosyltransferase involved in cell wall biosynthesis
MRDSLSIIFPVKDRQSEIHSQIERLLEWLCDLSRDVQLIAVDDESTDATPEILDELRRRYPQLEVVRKQSSVGPVQASESVLHRARGEFIFLHQSYEEIDLEEVLHLWKLRKDEQLVIARAATRVRRVDQQLLQRLHDWGKRLEDNWPQTRTVSGGLQMMRRDGVKGLSEIKDSLEDLEVTHQSHRRISGPKFIQPAGDSAAKTIKAP